MRIVCKTVVTVDYDLPVELTSFLDIFEKYVRLRAKKLGASSIYCRPSPSLLGLHCTICFPAELSELERLAIEAALLDDPNRVFYNLKRLVRHGRLNDLLFQLKTRLMRDVI